MLLDVTVKLPPEAIEGLTALAAERDVTPGQVIRDLLQREIKRGAAKRSVRADEPHVARLQRRLAVPMAEATSWSDLHRRMAERGFELRASGGGLTLHDAEGSRLCKSSELGFAYAQLVKRFAAPMPGHPQKIAHLSTQKAAERVPGDPILFESSEGG